MPPGSVARIPDLHLVTQPGQVVGRGQPARPRTDHKHPPAGGRRRRVEQPPALDRQIAQEPLDRVDRHRAVQLGPVAHALARVVADPAVDRRQRDCRRPAAARPARLARPAVGQPGLDVLARRAAGVARRQQIDIDGATSPNRPSRGYAVHEVRQWRDVARRPGHASAGHRRRGLEAMCSCKQDGCRRNRAKWL